jgi:hypothetical protein
VREVGGAHSVSPHFEAAAEELLGVVRRGEHYTYSFDDCQVR